MLNFSLSLFGFQGDDLHEALLSLNMVLLSIISTAAHMNLTWRLMGLSSYL